MSGRLIATGLALLLGLQVGVASAQTYPAKPVRLVVPFGGGGAGVDVVARGTAQALSDVWNQPVIVDNRPGASGIIAADLVAKSVADGYVLLFAEAPLLSVHPLVFPKLPYDPIKDFAPISSLAFIKQGLAVSTTLPVKNVREFLDYAKTKPGILNYGSYGTASGPHLAMELFKRNTGVEILHVPYKSPAAVVTDLMSGVLHSVIMGSSGNLVGASAQGRVRLLAVEGPKRSEVFPDVPTFEEAGLPGIRAPVWFGIVAPAGTPRPIVDKISRDLIRITGTAVFREKVIGAGREPGGSTPEAFATLIRDTTALWAPIVKAANITLE